MKQNAFTLISLSLLSLLKQSEIDNSEPASMIIRKHQIQHHEMKYFI